MRELEVLEPGHLKPYYCSPAGTDLHLVQIYAGISILSFPLAQKPYAPYPVVSSANRSGLFEVVVGLIWAVLRSRCAGFARPSLPRR